jgi:Fur family ferric uptake transcriptional regulator
MTSSATTQRLHFETLDDAIDLLRSRGLRLSTTRARLLDALFAAARPVSAESMASRLKLVPTTVYRNLEALERHGVVRHVHLGHGPGLYALISPDEREYIYCPACDTAKAVRPALLDPVRDYVSRCFGYQVRFTHFALVGQCPDCAGGADGAAPPS